MEGFSQSSRIMPTLSISSGTAMRNGGCASTKRNGSSGKALKVKPGNGYITDSLGWVYFKKNDLGKAIQYLRDAALAVPDDPTIAEHLGDAFAKAGQKEEALSALSEGPPSDPSSADLPRKIRELGGGNP